MQNSAVFFTRCNMLTGAKWPFYLPIRFPTFR